MTNEELQALKNHEIGQYKTVISDAELALQHKKKQIIQIDSEDWKDKALFSVGFRQMHDDTLFDMATILDSGIDGLAKDSTGKQVFDSHKFLKDFIETEKKWLKRCEEKWADREAEQAKNKIIWVK